MVLNLQDGFILAPLSKQIQRTTYDVFAVFGDIGGISSVILTVTAALIAPYAALLFRIDAIQALFKIQYQEKLPEITFMQASRVLSRICPDKNIK